MIARLVRVYEFVLGEVSVLGVVLHAIGLVCFVDLVFLYCVVDLFCVL